MLGGIDGRGVLLGHAGVELRGAPPGGLLLGALVAGELVELGVGAVEGVLGGVGLGGVGLRVGIGADGLLVVMDVVDQVPVAGGGLGGETVHIDGSMHGPGMDLGEGEVSVDDVDLVAVALGDSGEEAVVEAAAEGALEVIEVDEDDGSRGGASAGGPAGEFLSFSIGQRVLRDDGRAAGAEREGRGL